MRVLDMGGITVRMSMGLEGAMGMDKAIDGWNGAG